MLKLILGRCAPVLLPDVLLDTRVAQQRPEMSLQHVNVLLVYLGTDVLVPDGRNQLVQDVVHPQDIGVRRKFVPYISIKKKSI